MTQIPKPNKDDRWFESDDEAYGYTCCQDAFNAWLASIDWEKIVKEVLMVYGVNEASISLRYLKKKPRALYTELSNAIRKTLEVE